MQNLIYVNKDRIKKHINSFAEYGKTSNGGVTRLALSNSDKKARDYFYQYCKGLGLIVEIDDLGNIYATLKGKKEKPPIVIGSHLDTVVKGGRFDGVLGVVAGLEIIETLIEHDVTPEVPITVVNFTNEEGVRFEPAMMSSGVLAGKFEKEKVMQTADREGITFEQALKNIGYNGSESNRLQEATAFLELHIEQGPILEKQNKTIGIVECVVGMTCYEIEVEGESNHAGTTPMSMRKDALFVTTDIISNLRKNLDKLDEKLVYTIGRLDVYPNLHTIIPENVSFTIEARHKDMEIIKKVENIIENIKSMQQIDTTTLNVKKVWGRETVWFNEKFRKNIEDSALKLGYSNMKITSGAGHDAQFIAEISPTAMIFVPSVDGRSHSEDEYTSLDDCYKGINVLLNTVIQILEES